MLILYLLCFAILSVAITLFGASSDKFFNFKEKKPQYENDLENALDDIRKYMFYVLLPRFQEQHTLMSEKDSMLLDNYENQIGSINHSKTYLDECSISYNNFIKTFLLTGILTSPSSILVTVFDFERIFNENQVLNIVLGISYIFVIGIPLSTYFFHLHKKYKRKFIGIYESVISKLESMKLAIRESDIN